MARIALFVSTRGGHPEDGGRDWCVPDRINASPFCAAHVFQCKPFGLENRKFVDMWLVMTIMSA
jgi:hypothetical protein